MADTMAEPQPQISMTWTNLFQYISFISPILVIFFVTLYSIMQNNLERGLIFNMGIVIVSTFVYLIKRMLKNKQSTFASPFCNVIPGPFTVSDGGTIYDSPSMSTSILSFSSSYIIFPMVINNQTNYPLLVFLIVITCINAVIEYYQKCSDIMGIVLGLTLGTILGIAYYSALYYSNMEKKRNDLVYFSDTISNDVKCGKRGPQNFKCEVYKNGKLYTGPNNYTS